MYTETGGRAERFSAKQLKSEQNYHNVFKYVASIIGSPWLMITAVTGFLVVSHYSHKSYVTRPDFTIFFVVIKRIHGYKVNATVYAKPFFQAGKKNIQFMVTWPWDTVMVIKASWLSGTQNVVKSYG